MAEATANLGLEGRLELNEYSWGIGKNLYFVLFGAGICLLIELMRLVTETVLSLRSPLKSAHPSALQQKAVSRGSLNDSEHVNLIANNPAGNNGLELAHVEKVSADSESGNVLMIAGSNEGDNKLHLGSSRPSSRGSEIIVPKEATPMYNANPRRLSRPLDNQSPI